LDFIIQAEHYWKSGTKTLTQIVNELSLKWAGQTNPYQTTLKSHFFINLFPLFTWKYIWWIVMWWNILN
jgi:hypothetical protein